jgi:hypothetical protein
MPVYMFIHVSMVSVCIVFHQMESLLIGLKVRLSKASSEC